MSVSPLIRYFGFEHGNGENLVEMSSTNGPAVRDVHLVRASM